MTNPFTYGSRLPYKDVGKDDALFVRVGCVGIFAALAVQFLLPVLLLFGLLSGAIGATVLLPEPVRRYARPVIGWGLMLLPYVYGMTLD